MPSFYFNQHYQTKLIMIYDYRYWNVLVKPTKEVIVKAVPGDLVIEIGGIVYLCQTTDGFNNIVCFRRKKSDVTTLASFAMYRKWLMAQNIGYIRVEGNYHRYRFLEKIAEDVGYSIVKEREVKDRNIYFIKLYR